MERLVAGGIDFYSIPVNHPSMIHRTQRENLVAEKLSGYLSYPGDS